MSRFLDFFVRSLVPGWKAYAISAVLTVFVSGCNKKPQDDGVASPPNSKATEATALSPMRNHTMLGLLPNKVIGFSLVDYTLVSSSRWLTSVWGKSQHSLSELTKKLDDKDENLKKLITILENLEEGGLLPSSKSAGNVAQSIAFIATESLNSGSSSSGTERPAFVVVENFKSGVDGVGLLTTTANKIISAGIEFKENKIEGGASYTTEIVLARSKDKSAAIVKTPVTFAAKGSRFVITSSLNLPADNYLSDQSSPNTGIAELKQDPIFASTLAQVSDSSDEFSLSYLDTKRLFSAAGQWIPEEKISIDDLNKIPVQSIAYTRSMTDAMVDAGAITLATSANSADSMSKELAGVQATTFFSQAPAGLVGLLTLDGALVKALARSAISASPEKERAEMQSAITPILGTKELALAVRPQKGASPLPELAVLIEIADAPTVSQTISGLIASGAGTQGFLPPFQSKEINGVSVQYALSPFGAGVFVGHTPSHVLIASAETLLTDLIAIQKGSVAGALDTLSGESKKLLSDPLAVAAFQVDYALVAQVVESLSSSLGIFTGGQPLMEAQELNALRNLGKTAVQLVFKDGALRFISRSEPNKA